MSNYLAIDFGGTRIRAALFDEDMEMIRRTETLTHVQEGQQAVIQSLIEAGQSVTKRDESILGIGIAAPGPQDSRRGIISHAKTLPGWENVPLTQILQDAFNGVPVFMQNDGNLGALAEYHRGAGQEADPMLYLTISTGIGGGAIINRTLFTGKNGMAIEPGHIRLTMPDGSHRRLEELASGTALGNRARAMLKTSRKRSSLRKRELIDGRAVGQASEAGDELALQIVQEAGIYLGLGLLNLIHLFNPEAIVLGGSVMQLGGQILAPARRVIQQHVLSSEFLPDNLIRMAHFTEDMCLYGAVLHCRAEMGKSDDPF